MDEQQPSNIPTVTPSPATVSPAPFDPVAPKPKAGKLKHRIIIVVAVIGGILALLITGGILFVFYLVSQLTAGSGHSNQAQDALKPIQAQLSQLNAQELCTNGDNGYSLDNTQPWYTAYYSINSADSTLTEEISHAAMSAGYPLVTDTQRISDLQTGSNANGETYSSKNDYLTGNGKSSSGSLSIEIVRSGSIALDCGSTNDYGQLKSSPTGGAIVYLSMTFPSRAN